MKEIKTTVMGAAYIEDIDGIAVLLIDKKGTEYKHVMYSNEFVFKEGMDKAEEMSKLAKLMTGKKIKYCCDDDIEDQKNAAISSMMNKWKKG